jgi:hypothetical protein
MLQTICVATCISFLLLSTRFGSPSVDKRTSCEASVHNASKENTISLSIIEILCIQNGNMVLHTHTHIYEGNSISKLQIQVATYVFELSTGNCHCYIAALSSFIVTPMIGMCMTVRT